MLGQFAQSCEEVFFAGVEGAVGEVGRRALPDVGIEVGKGQCLWRHLLVQLGGCRLIKPDSAGGRLKQIFLAHGDNYTASRQPDPFQNRHIGPARLWTVGRR